MLLFKLRVAVIVVVFILFWFALLSLIWIDYTRAQSNWEVLLLGLIPAVLEGLAIAMLFINIDFWPTV